MNFSEISDICLRGNFDPDGTLGSVEILRAGPKILVSEELTLELSLQDCSRASCAVNLIAQAPYFATLTKPFVGGVLRIYGSNMTAVYVLTEYRPVISGLPLPGIFLAEWPD